MNRNILLIEPNYSNKYPPMGLMKLATYFKRCNDNVVFFKGEPADFVVEELRKRLIQSLYRIESEYFWEQHNPVFSEYIRKGNMCLVEDVISKVKHPSLTKVAIEHARRDFTSKNYYKTPHWDKVCICTLFTFYLKTTVETILWAKKLVVCDEDVIVGGIASSLVPDYIEAQTGIKPIIGLLDKPGMLDEGNSDIIDTLPLDFSILSEIDYKYPASNAYFSYTTRGCINKCSFCAVPKLEPEYKSYIPLKRNINYTKKHFGEQKDLLLLDNNVLASKDYFKIINDIKSLGFVVGATYIPSNQLEITIQNLKVERNKKPFINKFCDLMQDFLLRLHGDERQSIYDLLEEHFLLRRETATEQHIMMVYPIIKNLYELRRKKSPSNRYVDFNQGLDAALFSDEKIKLLSEIPIRPVRIAFDHWSEREIYTKAVHMAARHGLSDLSNYLLYNSNNDTPEQLYFRLELNVLLCEELNIAINSFPMKYHPITDENFFTNRDFIGKHWTKKFVRAIQAILNATKGSVGRGKSFFYHAFGQDINEYKLLLHMPEAMIIYRVFFENNGIMEQWRKAFLSLSQTEKDICLPIIQANSFKQFDASNWSDNIRHLLRFYLIHRDDVAKALKEKKDTIILPEIS